MKTTIDNTQTTYGKYSLIYIEDVEIKDTATVVSLDFSRLLETPLVRYSACFALLAIAVRSVFLSHPSPTPFSPRRDSVVKKRP